MHHQQLNARFIQLGKPGRNIMERDYLRKLIEGTEILEKRQRTVRHISLTIHPSTAAVSLLKMLEEVFPPRLTKTKYARL